MRLELASYPVKEVVFGRATRYESGTLTISRDELDRLVLEDPRISKVELQVVTPGEGTRIAGVMDVVEPRVKVQGEGTVFPGLMGPPTLVGSGTTNRLSNFAVVTAMAQPVTKGGRPGGGQGEILDMSGPGVLSPVSQQSNLVMELEVAPGYTPDDYHYSAQMAELKVASHLAKTTANLKPQDAEVFELTPADPGLPSVVYICCWNSSVEEFGVTFYGQPVGEWMPIYAHPNEVLDGAFANRIGGAKSTWSWQNHPGVLVPYRHHGKRFNYKGMILQRTGYMTMEGKLRACAQAAKLAQTIGAQTAIVTWFGASGQLMIETMTTVQNCEKLGIKTVPLVLEYNNQTGAEPPLVFMVPEAVSVVSLGHNSRYLSEGPLRLPPMDKVIGRKETALDSAPGQPGLPTQGEIPVVLTRGIVFEGVDIWGDTMRTTREF